MILSGTAAPLAAHAASSVTINHQKKGRTQFIEMVEAQFQSSGTLASVQFTITPKTGSVTRPVSATYSAAYMISQGYWDGKSDNLELPVFGLYAGATNAITMDFVFSDGSKVEQPLTFTTEAYTDKCGALNTPDVVVPRQAPQGRISFDYLLLKKYCDKTAPTIMDSDGEVRWIGTGDTRAHAMLWFNNKFYISDDKTQVAIMRFDGSYTSLADYAGIGVTTTNHHNFDPGKTGIMMDVDTLTQTESVDVEIDGNGKVLQTFDMAAIISAAMIAGGDDPAGFVYPVGNDWFHNNATTYNPADNTEIISSRENFVIAVDYDTKQIKWILGDHTKHWYQYKSLRAFALNWGKGTHPPIGQHGISIDHNGDLLLYDDGFQSVFQKPPGISRSYSTPRAYRIDTKAMTATEVFNYQQHQSIYTQVCGSIYEDAPDNYLIDYATESHRTITEFVGLDPRGAKVFDYKFPNVDNCGTAWNTQIIHMEDLQF